MADHADIDHTGLTGVGVGDATAHIADTTDAHDASAISFTPAGTIAATDVQAAIEEVASEAAGGSFDEDLLPWLIDIDVFGAHGNTNFDSVVGSTTNAIHAWWIESNGTQNAERYWDVVLAAGTWDVMLIYVKGTDRGIYSVQFDGVEKGTVDGYNGSTTYNNRTSVTGITVATSAKIRLKLKMATKNASSSNYYGDIIHVQLRRTA